jgi:hypothetical protein
MFVQPSHYEALLAEYCDRTAIIDLLKQFRPYLEMVPSMRRPSDSLITLPLPLVRIRSEESAKEGMGRYRSDVLSVPCEVALLMCDPEWKIKTGVEICIFIYRPQEDFSDLLGRWRQTQMLLSKTYEWIMPPRYRHILSDGAEDVLPLFVVFEGTPVRVLRGLQGAHLPFVIQRPDQDLVGEELTPDLGEELEDLVG